MRGPRDSEEEDEDEEGGRGTLAGRLWLLARRTARRGVLAIRSWATRGEAQKEVDRRLWSTVAADDEEGVREALEAGANVGRRLMELGPHERAQDDNSWKTPLHLAAHRSAHSPLVLHTIPFLCPNPAEAPTPRNAAPQKLH